MSHLVAVREAGIWRVGRWVVDHAERCAHRHASVEAARACLLRWDAPPVGMERDGKGWRVQTRDWHRNGYGRVVRVDGGGEFDALLVRPDRNHTRSGKVGRVAWTWTHWHAERPDPRHPRHPVEFELSCGEWSVTYIGGRNVTPSVVAGVALGLHLLLETTDPAALVAIQQAARRSSQEDPVAEGGVVVFGPWGTAR